MARPLKNNAEYFTHDSDMRNDVKIRALRRKFKHVGYSVWCFLLEVLTDSDYFETNWDEINIELLSADFDISSEELKEIVEYCVKLDLLQIENNKLFSKTHRGRFNALLVKRSRDRDYIKSEKEVIANENHTEIPNNEVIVTDKEVIVTENDIVKESKEEYSKEDNNISNEIYAEPVSASSEFSKFISDFNKIRGSRFQAIDKVKRQFNARLKEGFTPAQMLQALENAMQDKFHITEGYRFLTPEFFTRPDKIEKFLNVQQKEKPSIAPEKLGVGEWMRPDGTRTYGTGSSTVPNDAPPRPSEAWWWNAGLNQWNM